MPPADFSATTQQPSPTIFAGVDELIVSSIANGNSYALQTIFREASRRLMDASTHELANELRAPSTYNTDLRNLTEREALARLLTAHAR